mgnify:CR=1 FL=1
MKLLDTLYGAFAAIPESAVALLARFSMAAVFWKSGQTKVEGFAVDLVDGQFMLGWPHLSSSAVDLFREEYKLPLIAPELAAPLAATAEHVLPLLLLVGLGTRLSAEVTAQYGMAALNPGHIHVRLRGTAGQSLGAFLCQGITLEVFGDANDYVGKGLSGGRIVVRPTVRSPLLTRDNSIIGNTVLYGATSGQLFAAGQAGDFLALPVVDNRHRQAGRRHAHR